MQVIRPGSPDLGTLADAAAMLRSARNAVALTGAGISVASGIPDFRSTGGLWTVFSPDEYATLEVFYRKPAKAWELYRALGQILLGRTPNPAHRALAELERQGLLQGIVTQNVDNLHQQAGSTRVFEIHGDHQHLQCLHCGTLVAAEAAHYRGAAVPLCARCAFPLKPNVVLFGEAVRHLEAIQDLIAACDLLLVVGTSAQVYPAAALPAQVRAAGGRLFEFNREPALAASGHNKADVLFLGDVVHTLPLLVRACARGWAQRSVGRHRAVNDTRHFCVAVEYIGDVVDPVDHRGPDRGDPEALDDAGRGVADAKAVHVPELRVSDAQGHHRLFLVQHGHGHAPVAADQVVASEYPRPRPPQHPHRILQGRHPGHQPPVHRPLPGPGRPRRHRQHQRHDQDHRPPLPSSVHSASRRQRQPVHPVHRHQFIFHRPISLKACPAALSRRRNSFK